MAAEASPADDASAPVTLPTTTTPATASRVPRHVLTIVAVVFAVSLLKGLRMPNLWSATHMTFNYTKGFIRRGLFGQVLRFVGGRNAYHYQTLALLAVILFVLAALATARLARRVLATDGGDWALVAMTLVFAASPGVVFLAHEIGYLDYVGLVAVPLFIVWAARGTHRWAIFYVATALSVVLSLIHESMMIMFAPTIWLAMACHIVAQDRARSLSRRTRAWMVVHAVVAALVALVASSAVGVLGTKSADRILALQASIARSADFPLRGDGFEALYRPVRDNLLHLMPWHWSFPDNRRYLATGLVVSLPGLAVLSVYGVRLIARLRLPRLTCAVLGALLLGATIAPLGLNFVGWDSARWNAISFVAAFNCIATLRLFFCCPVGPGADGVDVRRYRIDDPWMLTAGAAAIIFGLTSNYAGFLFDGYVVQWFPFDGQLRSLLDLIQGHFRFLPRA